MQRYQYTVDVINTFKDTITVEIEAEHAGVARKAIRSAMEQFPGKVTSDSPIRVCYIENRDKVATEVVSIVRRQERLDE